MNENGQTVSVRSSNGSEWCHVQLRLRYKPYGVIDFNRPDLFARAVMEALPKIIWLGDIEGWKGEPDAYLAIGCEREIEVFGDLPRKSQNNNGDERRSPERPAVPSVPHTTENPQW